MANSSSTLQEIAPSQLQKNPNNPRRYFNDDRLDLLRTSIQEVGVLVPLIVYQHPEDTNRYVLMDGERRWICAADLGFDSVPANVIPAPSELENLLRMFNIHAVREDWPLISVALSLKEVMDISQETRESRLAEMTGLTRSTVRRAKRLLTLPGKELELIQADAHLDRTDQVHREDLYLEIQAAESVLRNELPEIAEKYPREKVIRQFARKREEKTLTAVTDFRDVGKLVKAAEDNLVSRSTVIRAAERLIDDVAENPKAVFNEVAARAYEQQAIARKAELLYESLLALGLEPTEELPESLVTALQKLRGAIDTILGGR